VAYGRKVYGLSELLGRVMDERRKPVVQGESVAAAVFYTGLLRIRSFNALEPKLSEKAFLRLLGARETSALCCADTLSRALRVMDLETLRAISVSMLAKAERNKVFREGWYGTLRYFALDGWESHSSRLRHCRECLERKVRVSGSSGEITEVVEYYHRYVVAMMIDERFDLALDIEPLLPSDLRPAVVRGKKKDRITKPDEDEGELTTAIRLLKRVRETFPWLDVVVADALYANGPFLNLVRDLGLGAVIVARKETDEPLKEALHLWGQQQPCKIVEDEPERVELWDCPDLETLGTYEGKIRVVRGRVTRLKEPQRPPSTWCMLVTGRATRLAPEKVLKVTRARWHIENTGFHQWTTRWRFGHVFLHDAHGMRALYWLFFAAFNLLTLFLYCQVRSYGRDRGKNVTRTISRLVDEMQNDLVLLDRLAWDTS
jgi:Transposase DDE domain